MVSKNQWNISDIENNLKSYAVASTFRKCIWKFTLKLYIYFIFIKNFHYNGIKLYLSVYSEKSCENTLHWICTLSDVALNANSGVSTIIETKTITNDSFQGNMERNFIIRWQMTVVSSYQT